MAIFESNKKERKKENAKLLSYRADLEKKLEKEKEANLNLSQLRNRSLMSIE